MDDEIKNTVLKIIEKLLSGEAVKLKIELEPEDE